MKSTDERKPVDAATPTLLKEYAVVSLDASGRVTEWNAGAARLLGHEAADALGQELGALLGSPESTRELLRRAAAAGSADGTDSYTSGHGRSFPAEVTVNALHGPESELNGYVVVIRDTSEPRRLHREMSRSSEVFEGILAIATDGVVCVDSAQRITFFNQGAERIFGYTADEVLGQPLDLLIPEMLRDRHGAHLGNFAASPVTSRQMGERGEISGRRKDGSVFPAEASISKLSVGDSVLFTAVLRDISERKEAEEALARQAAELARSNAELEQFAYVASHDLQEPLRMVASYTQLLARRYGDRLDEDGKEFIGYAVDGVTRMQALINDLLAYSRVGRRDIAPQQVDTGEVVQRVLVTLGPTIEETGAVVTSDPLPAVDGDPVQLTQLFQNLITNALKFHGDAPPAVHVGARQEAEEWVFRVSDNGIGIAPEFSQRIFDIFQRLHSRSDYPGTGIGLAICKRIVERHGGRIWVESREGAGATFYFTLPRHDGSQ